MTYTRFLVLIASSSLADGIIEAQRREITEMRALIADLEGEPDTTSEIEGNQRAAVDNAMSVKKSAKRTS